MRISKIETIRLKQYGNLLWVVIHADDGTVGLGETFFEPAAVEAWIHEFAAPRLLGEDPLRIEHHNRNLQGYVGFRGSGAEMRGLSACDLALWDLWGKATGLPLYQLFGGRSRESVRTYNTCAGYAYIREAAGQASDNWGLASSGPYEDLQAFLDDAGKLAESLLEQGITAMKIWPLDTFAEASGGTWISAADLKQGLEPFRKIRKAVGDRMEIMLECHGLWDLPCALRIADAVREFDPFWIEDPIRLDSVAALAEFRRRSGLRTTLSETLAGCWGVKDAIDANAVDYVMLDLGWIGGPTQARKAAALAEAAKLPIAPHDCTGPVVYAASTHLSVSAPHAVLQESVRAFYNGWYKEVATELPEVADGMVKPPPGSGHGVQLREEVFKREDLVLTAAS